MGTSAFDPIVLADVRSVRHNLYISGLTGEVLSVGDVIRYDPVNDRYFKAIANSQENAIFVGVIESITANSIELVYSGEISLPNALFGGKLESSVFYLSATEAGKLTATPPSTPGSIVKPVIITKGTLSGATDEVDGVVVNTLGNAIAGDSYVDLSDIQPIGSISAFAGNTSDIPNGWDLCDGGLLSISTYSDLYNSLSQGKLYGFTQTVSMNYQSGGGDPLTAGQLVGSKFDFITTVGNIECTILSVTMSDNNVSSAEVLVEPVFKTGSSTGTYHNTLLISTTNITIGGSGTQGGSIYSLIAGEGNKTRFRKPDLRSRFLVGSSRSMTGAEPSAFNSYTIGLGGGEEEHVLTVSELANHNHTPTFTLTTTPSGAHDHGLNTAGNPSNGMLIGPGIHARQSGAFGVRTFQAEPNHTHQITGNIDIANAGGNQAHNNVPQHVVVYWIIKTRKDSVAKIFRLGPSGGGAVIAKNTPKRWARMTTPGAGCTVDISYGNFGVTRLGTGDYRFTHDMTAELGTGEDQTKYIVEATVIGTGGSQMLLANPYGLEGTTLGVRIWDVRGATFSDSFEHLCLTIYGGGTAL